MSFRILSQDCRISNESYLTGLNNNDLIVGPSGAGKTRGYVLPNILQCSESLIVADTKNTLRAETEAVLRQNGYKIYSLDLCGGPSSGYDPLDYIRLDPRTERYNEQDIMAVAAALVPIESPQEPFWEFSARIYLESIIGYVLECLPEEEHTMDMVVRLSRELGTGRLAKLMDELALFDPDSFAVRRYTICRDGERADKTNACVLMFLAEKLAPLDYEGAKAMFHNPDKIHMAQLGREKTALFLGVSDTDRSMDRLANLFYAQALHVLCDEADRRPGRRLNVPVRFILDDFAANAFIPDFDKILSVIRSRNISASVILQSISQLEGMYGHAAAMTILNNCDHCLYLGGQDVETARYMGVKANRSVGTMLSMPLDSAWLFARGEPARLTKKFDLHSHQRYHELPEAGGAAQNMKRLSRRRPAMPAAYDSLRALSRQTMKGLLDAPGWQKFLAFAGRSFKLPFPAQVLAYAQRPEAFALMKSSEWDAFGRPVKKGSHGIPVPEGGGKKLVYYYDIADTRETDKSKPVPLWHVRSEHYGPVAAALESYFGKLEDASGFAGTLLAAARKATAYTVDDRLDDLAAHRPGSLLEELDGDNLLAAYSTVMENSVGYMLLARCGIEPTPYLAGEDFRGLLDFNTPSTLSILGSAVVETAAMCLSVIARAVRGMQAAPVPLQSDAGERYTLQGKWELSVVGGDADSILYRFLDLPEQGPASASRKDFEQWLAAGFVQPVTAAIPA